MNTSLHYRMAGLGQTTGQLATSAVTSALGTAAIFDPEPISKTVLAVTALVTGFVSSLFHPNLNKIATSEIVQKAEVLLKQNLTAWQALPASQRNSATQAAALQNFDTVWTQVLQACIPAQYGSAATACIADRQQGACHYQVNGQCWNWFAGYRDPIANDPAVTQNAAAAPTSTSTAISLSPAGFDPTLLMLIGGAVVLMFMVGES